MVSIKLFATIIVALILLSVWRELLWREERRDLYNRIMAGGLSDYKENIAEKPPPKGGNMFTAGMKRAAHREALHLNGGDD